MEKRNSISISFEDSWQQDSVALFSSYLGRDLIKYADEFISDYYPSHNPERSPVAGEIMVSFLFWLSKNKNISDEDLYLGSDFNDGINYENGHCVISISGKHIREYSVKEIDSIE